MVNDISYLIQGKLHLYLKLALLQEEKTFGRHNKTPLLKFHNLKVDLA